MKRAIFICIFFTAFVLTSAGWGFNLLVWDKDEGDEFFDPGTTNLIGSEENVVNSLTANGESPTVVTTLPSDLSAYDVVFVCTGWYVC